MAFTVEKPFSDFCQETGFRIDYGPLSYTSENVSLMLGAKRGTIRNSESMLHQVLSWASVKANTVVGWDLGIISPFGYDYLLQQRKTMAGKPTECALEPGSAFDMVDHGAGFFTDTVRPRPILPPREMDGSYAFCVKIADLLDPEEWLEEAKRCGFYVRTSADSLRYYGSRFPGGELNFTPPLRLIPWLDSVRVKDRFPDSPSEIKNSSRYPLLGRKMLSKIPEYSSISAFRNAVASRMSSEVHAVLTDVPDEISAQAQEAGASRKRAVVGNMVKFMERCKKAGMRVFFHGFLTELKNTARCESEYCAVLESFGRYLGVDWAHDAEVFLKDQEDTF